MEGKRWNAALEGYLDELNSGKSLDPNLILQSFLKPTSYVSEFLRYAWSGLRPCLVQAGERLLGPRSSTGRPGPVQRLHRSLIHPLITPCGIRRTHKKRLEVRIFPGHS